MHSLKVIAHIKTDFKEKFGIPRQSGVVSDLKGKIVFEKKYRNIDSVRGLEKFSHLWLLWQFSLNSENECFPTVRPPRLGGDERIGVFATRSPFRPNSLGLSCVELESIDKCSVESPVIYVKGIDLLDGTPIYDIKPYIPYTDSHPNASCSFAKSEWERELSVNFPNNLLDIIEESKKQSLIKVLAQDPRPAYKSDSNEIYTMNFADYEISFFVKNKILTVTDVVSDI